jgi:hypothetical protein
MTLRFTKKCLLTVILLALVFSGAMPRSGGGHSADESQAFSQAAEGWHDHAHSSEDGHVHEDGSDEERDPGHRHDHNPFDHSHETMGPVPVISMADPNVFALQRPAYGISARTGPPLYIERPPKASAVS